MLRDAITYPWRRGGAFILVPGTFVLLALAVASWAPLLGLASTLIGLGYFSAFYFQIIETTISGRHTLPDWPEFSDFYDDVVRPALQMIGIYILYRIIVYFFAWLLMNTGLLKVETLAWDRLSGSWFPFLFVIRPGRALQMIFTETGWLHHLDALVFWLYLPMAVLGVIFHGSLSGAMPWRVLPAISRCWRVYVPGAACMWAVHDVVSELQDFAVKVPYLGYLLVGMLMLCLLVMQARLTGCFGAHYAHRITPPKPEP
jgi:hypothetical protein